MEVNPTGAESNMAFSAAILRTVFSSGTTWVEPRQHWIAGSWGDAAFITRADVDGILASEDQEMQR